MSIEDQEGLDDFLDSLGIDTKPLSPEHALMLKLDGGAGYKEIHNYRYFIRHEMFYYYHLLEEGLILCKEKIVDTDTFNKGLVEANKYDWARVRTKYYLQMKYLPWFTNNLSGIGVANLDKMTQMLLDHELVRPVIEANKEDLPRN